MDKVRSVLISGLVVLGMGVEANASTSVSAAYGQCKAEVLEKFGGDTRITMKGSKKYSGTLTVKLICCTGRRITSTIAMQSNR